MVCKQVIQPTAINNSFRKLEEINPFYGDVVINNQWHDVSKESNPVLWDLVTNDNTVENDAATETGSDDNTEGNDALKEKQNKKNQVPLLTVMHDVDGLNIWVNEVMNKAPGEGQVSVAFTLEPDWEALVFLIIYQLVRTILILKEKKDLRHLNICVLNWNDVMVGLLQSCGIYF